MSLERGPLLSGPQHRDRHWQPLLGGGVRGRSSVWVTQVSPDWTQPSQGRDWDRSDHAFPFCLLRVHSKTEDSTPGYHLFFPLSNILHDTAARQELRNLIKILKSFLFWQKFDIWSGASSYLDSPTTGSYLTLRGLILSACLWRGGIWNNLIHYFISVFSLPGDKTAMTSGSVLDAVQLISIIKLGGSDKRKTLVVRSRRRS